MSVEDEADWFDSVKRLSFYNGSGEGSETNKTSGENLSRERVLLGSTLSILKKPVWGTRV